LQLAAHCLGDRAANMSALDKVGDEWPHPIL